MFVRWMRAPISFEYSVYIEYLFGWFNGELSETQFFAFLSNRLEAKRVGQKVKIATSCGNFVSIRKT